MRRLHRLRYSFSSLSSTLTARPHAAPACRLIPACESECGDRLGSVEGTRFRASRVIESFSGGFGDRRSAWRPGLPSARSGGCAEGLGVGDRGFAAKAKKAGGKARTSKHALCFSCVDDALMFLGGRLLLERTMMTIIKVSFA